MIKSKKKLADCRLQTAYLPILLMTLILLLSSTTEIHPTIRYVSHTGNSTPPYTSWETAADSIQKAINICEPGDTVLVANGVYEEYLIINTPISLIGSSTDSTIIDGSQIPNPPNNFLIRFNVDIEMKFFTINGNEQNELMNGVVTISGASLTIDSCEITNFYQGLALGNSSSTVTNCKIKYCRRAIRDECPNNNCTGVYTNNIIISRNNGTSPAVYFSFGGYPTFTNNIVIEEGTNTWTGIFSGQKPGAVIKNNLVGKYLTAGIQIGAVTMDTTYIINNNINNINVSGSYGGAIITSTGDRTRIENNIIKDSYRSIYKINTPEVRVDYNLIWKVQELMNGQPFIGDSNIFADPMFVKDTIPNPHLDFDYHLQAYSPAIDAGNPAILDVDESRSDIGMFGGPLGESYKYRDLSPRPPRNLSALVDTSYILVKWNRNTEADTSHYNVYRDTVANFKIDSTKLISSQSDTFFIQYPPYQSSQYVYKITCVDNQGNESFPSEELVINITSLTTNDYPMTVNDYLLYQNFPNPFNPTSTISYKLKERAYVKLMVYDIKGELISVLVNKEQESGYYEVEFNGGNLINQIRTGDLASGIYLYRIEVIGEGKIPVYSDMKKMLLVK